MHVYQKYFVFRSLFFVSPGQRPAAKNEFSDILGAHGFKPLSEQQRETLGQLKKQTDTQDMDPIKARVFIVSFYSLDVFLFILSQNVFLTPLRYIFTFYVLVSKYFSKFSWLHENNWANFFVSTLCFTRSVLPIFTLPGAFVTITAKIACWGCFHCILQ